MDDEPKPPKTKAEKLNALTDLIFKIGTPLGLGCLFFLKSQFVTTEEFKAYMTLRDERINKIEMTLAVMAEQNRTNTRQDEVLSDHEKRIRLLENNNGR
jgi:hypothetical protein